MRPPASLPLASGGWAKTQVAYRRLDNDALDWREVLEVSTRRTGERMQGPLGVLCLPEMTEVEVTRPPGIAGLGRLSYAAPQGLSKYKQVSFLAWLQ